MNRQRQGNKSSEKDENFSTSNVPITLLFTEIVKHVTFNSIPNVSRNCGEIQERKADVDLPVPTSEIEIVRALSQTFISHISWDQQLNF